MKKEAYVTVTMIYSKERPFMLVKRVVRFIPDSPKWLSAYGPGGQGGKVQGKWETLSEVRENFAKSEEAHAAKDAWLNG